MVRFLGSAISPHTHTTRLGRYHTAFTFTVGYTHMPHTFVCLVLHHVVPGHTVCPGCCGLYTHSTVYFPTQFCALWFTHVGHPHGSIILPLPGSYYTHRGLPRFTICFAAWTWFAGWLHAFTTPVTDTYARLRLDLFHTTFVDHTVDLLPFAVARCYSATHRADTTHAFSSVYFAYMRPAWNRHTLCRAAGSPRPFYPTIRLQDYFAFVPRYTVRTPTPVGLRYAFTFTFCCLFTAGSCRLLLHTHTRTRWLHTHTRCCHYRGSGYTCYVHLLVYTVAVAMDGLLVRATPAHSAGSTVYHALHHHIFWFAICGSHGCPVCCGYTYGSVAAGLTFTVRIFTRVYRFGSTFTPLLHGSPPCGYTPLRLRLDTHTRRARCFGSFRALIP